MKTLFVFVLTQLIIFAAPFSQVLAAEPAVAGDSTHVTYTQGREDGRQSATENYHSSKWLWYGTGSGFLLGLIGSGVICAVSQMGSPQPPTQEVLHIADGTDAYQVAFGDAYAKRAKKKAFGMALIGSLVGTTVAVAVVSSMQK